MENSYRHFSNKDCEFFPCHKVDNIEDFNCLFCYCPLYFDDNCGGNYSILSNGIKDCSECLKPHYDYDFVIGKIMQKMF